MQLFVANTAMLQDDPSEPQEVALVDASVTSSWVLAAKDQGWLGSITQGRLKPPVWVWWKVAAVLTTRHESDMSLEIKL